MMIFRIDGSSAALIAFIISVRRRRFSNCEKILALVADLRLPERVYQTKSDVFAGKSDEIKSVVRIKSSSESRIASFAFSIGKPAIEPLVSSTKTISFGVISSSTKFVGRLKKSS